MPYCESYISFLLNYIIFVNNELSSGFSNCYNVQYTLLHFNLFAFIFVFLALFLQCVFSLLGHLSLELVTFLFICWQ